VVRSSLTRLRNARQDWVPADGDVGHELALCPIECPNTAQVASSKKKKITLECGIVDGETRTRTGDTTIFRQLHATLERPGKSRKNAVFGSDGRKHVVRKLHAMVGAVGHETPLVSQWSDCGEVRACASPIRAPFADRELAGVLH
jgi:hypothetical protein